LRLVRFLMNGVEAYGIVRGECVQPISWEPFEEVVPTSETLDTDSVRLLAPVVPSKIVGIGLNYTDHASEVGLQPPAEPALFLKASSTVLEPGGAVVLPPQSKRVDYEGELAVIIGREARSVDRGDAASFVFGYTCGLDMTARDLQAADVQWTRAKNFDTFCPLGPWVETELDPADLALELRLNGDVRQSSRTSNMIFDVPYLVSFVSSVMTLYPGDVIMTGTPAGIGQVGSGDTVEVSIEGIGTLSVSIA
jgi:2-keto-4-pentenoate hydratase/2-oxohepta-3-ene-1,7-dioic acid hydratase in catechol pathway